MVRSIWKGIFVEADLKEYKNINNNKIMTKSRSSVIIPYFLDKTIYVYNGKKYIGINITKQAFGRKLGEYAFTKKPAVFPKKKGK